MTNKPKVFDLEERTALFGMTVIRFVKKVARNDITRPIIDQLNRAVREAFDPELKAKLAETAMDVAPTSPEELRKLISSEIKLHGELLKTAGWVPQ